MENLFNFCFEDFSYPDSLPIQNLEPAAPPQPYEEVEKDGKKYIHCAFPNCGKTFRFKSEYQRHSVIHTVQRPFNCPYTGCLKTFKREDALKNHLRIHTGELPFKCEAEGCQESFPTKAGLRYHMLKHNGEKTFMCGYPGCNKSFLTQAQLRQHENSINFHKKIAWQAPEAQSVQVQPVQAQPVQTPVPVTVTVNKVQKVKEPSLDSYFAPNMKTNAGIEWGTQNQLEGSEEVDQNLQEDFEKMVKVLLKDNNAMKQRIGMCNTLMSLMQENNALKQKLDKVSGQVAESTNVAPELSDEQIYSFLNFSNQNVGF